MMLELFELAASARAAFLPVGPSWVKSVLEDTFKRPVLDLSLKETCPESGVWILIRRRERARCGILQEQTRHVHGRNSYEG